MKRAGKIKLKSIESVPVSETIPTNSPNQKTETDKIPIASGTRIGAARDHVLVRTGSGIGTRSGGQYPGRSDNGARGRSNSIMSFATDGVRSLSTRKTYQKREPVKPRQKIVIGCFAVYSVICLGFIVATAVIWAIVSYYRLKYFVREPYTTPFFELETDCIWMGFKFLLGAVTHLSLSVMGACFLSGRNCIQYLISKSVNKAKIFLWLAIIAVIGDVIMADASLDYVLSTPTVLNGIF